MISKIDSQSSSRSDIKLPIEMVLPLDIVDPRFRDMVDLALLRVFGAASLLEARPPRLFPTAETVLAKSFIHDDSFTHEDLEIEMGKMSYMLSNLPERGMPTECISLIRFVLSSVSVLTAWERTLLRLRNKIREEIQWVIQKMQEQQQQLNISSYQKTRFIAIPVDYRTDATTSSYAIQLWERSLSEIVVEVSKGNFEHTKAFLQIFAFLKDPLGGLESVSDKAVDFMAYLTTFLASFVRQTGDHSLTRAKWHAAVTQAAQEALFLACPLLEHISYIHFAGHQQLPYVYVTLDQLPRSEFSIPEHVLQIIEEILTAGPLPNGESCPIAPITVCSYPTLPIEQGKHTTVILDGNHRATATMILRLIAEHSIALTTNEAAREALDAFCIDHNLGRKWKTDLSEVLETLLRGNHYYTATATALIRSKMDLVKRFQNLQHIPALVVREDDFFTECHQRPPLTMETPTRRRRRRRLVLPIHQAIYNDDDLDFAFPQAGQVHGRAFGFKPMALLSSLSSKNSEVESNRIESNQATNHSQILISIFNSETRNPFMYESIYRTLRFHDMLCEIFKHDNPMSTNFNFRRDFLDLGVRL